MALPSEYCFLKKSFMRLRILFLFLLILPIWSAGQTIPVGTPVLEDAYRRAQLLGELDS